MFIGRRETIKNFQYCFDKEKSSLITIRGRRRVGKSFLANHFIKLNKKSTSLVLQMTGTYNLSLKDQIENVKEELLKQLKDHKSKKVISLLENLRKATKWNQIFGFLNDLFKLQKKKTILLIDEVQWLDSVNSNFLNYLIGYWNQADGFEKQNVFMMLCGSSSIWIEEKIINNTGGFHQRADYNAKIEPFTLLETIEFLKTKYRSMKLEEIIEIYFMVGGVAKYLDEINNKGLIDNAKRLFFNKDAILKNEFKNIFASLFKEGAFIYQSIVEELGKHKKMTKQDLSQIFKNNDLKTYLEGLEELGFVARKNFKDKETKEEYILIDPFSIFYLRWKNDLNNFLKKDRSYDSWKGLAFETLCFNNINFIKNILGIGNILTDTWIWYNKKAQIDLILSRTDHVDMIIECKFYKTKFKVNKEQRDNIENKYNEYSSVTNAKIEMILLTLNGAEPFMINGDPVEVINFLEELYKINIDFLLSLNK